MHYQAVLFAGGRGSRMSDLTTTIPKCLLPVANVPMIVYPLAMLQNAKFDHAFVLVPAKCAGKTKLKNDDKIEDLADVKRIIKLYNISLKLDFVDVPENEDLGTAEALQLLLPKLTKNVLFLSCDFICDFPLNKFIDWHDANGSSLSALLSKLTIQGNAPGPKTKRKTERDLIALQSDTSRLAFLSGETDFEDDFVTLHRNLISSEFVSVKTDLLPFVIKLQHYKWGCLPKDVQHVLASLPGFTKNDCFDLKCLAYTMTNDEFSICARLNNTGSYFEANKQVIKFLPKFFADSAMAPLAQSHRCPDAQVGADSFLGMGTTSGRKCQIKRSVIGKNCTLGENCKINNCVLMDDVRIGNGSVLVNCIVCRGSEILEKCDLKDCMLSTNQHVQSATKLSAEIVGGEISRMLEI